MSILNQIEAAPNPQFARLPITELCGEWEFAFDDDNVGLQERWSQPAHRLGQRITVPYPPESALSGIHETGYHRVFWYKRDIATPSLAASERALLRFGAVDHSCQVWVNDLAVGRHEGGSTPFAFDITDALRPDQPHQIITLRAEDHPWDQEQPRGKQSWTAEPEIIHYYRTSGIWQPVWLEIVPLVHIETIHWGWDPELRTITADVSLTDEARPGSTLTVALEHEDKPFLTASATAVGREIRVMLDARHGNRHEEIWSLQWNPWRPTLLGARLTLAAPGEPSDELLSYTGLRTVDTDNGRFQINRHDTFLRMVLNQGYFHESGLAAPDAAAIRRDVELILALGFNGARNHQKVEDPRFLFWADRLGLMVWGEIGNAFAYSDRAIRRHLHEWEEAVLRDRNHPSIIAWVPFNESWGVEDVALSARQQAAVRTAYWRTHQLDGSRPVIGNDGWEHVIGDVFTLHDYSWDPAELINRYGRDATCASVGRTYRMGHRTAFAGATADDFAGKPAILSEYGGVSFAPQSGESWFGYGKVTTDDEFIAQYEALTRALHHSAWLAGFCYTQFTDTEQEMNGLLRADRSPKVPLERIAPITRGEAAR